MFGAARSCPSAGGGRARTATKRNLPSVVQTQNALGQRPISNNLQLRLSAFNGSKIPSMLLHRITQMHPVRMVIRHPDLLHGRDISNT